MAGENYQKYILTELKMDQTAEAASRYSRFASRILWMDAQNTPGAFQMNCSWYFRPPKQQLLQIHHHDAPEILGFFGSDHKNPHELGGEIEFWLEDEKFTITKSSMIFIPEGMRHCPLILKRVDRPIFHFSTVTRSTWEMLGQIEGVMPEPKDGRRQKSRHAQYVVSDLHVPPEMELDMIQKMEQWNHLILWVDNKVIPGAFQMNCCWFDRVPPEQPYFAHKHDVPEIIGLFGGDPLNPANLNGEVEFWMEDEKFIINKSCMIFVPAGVSHCPLYIKRVSRPIFHYSVVTSPLYTQLK